MKLRKLHIRELNRLSQEDFQISTKIPLTLVLDNIRSLHNIGSIFRTSDAFRVEEIILCGISACPPNAEIHKTALGAEFCVKWNYYEDTVEAIQKLKKRKYQILGIEQAENSQSLTQIALKDDTSYAIVLGNEVKGVQQEVIDLCDACIEIPQFGTKHSLNVSVAAGLVIWDLFQQLSTTIISEKQV